MTGDARFERARDHLGAAVRDLDDPLASADRLCRACVDVLDVDGASVSLVLAGASQGTFGSSSELSRRVDEFQFTFGEGPCYDAVTDGVPVLASDLRRADEERWPAFRGAVLDEGIGAVFALPVSVNERRVGALDLFRHAPGSLSASGLDHGAFAAEMARRPLMALVASGFDDMGAEPATDAGPLAPLERVEIYQATGMIVAALGVGPDEALLRLRAHAYATGMTADEVAWEIVERRLSLEDDRGDGRPDAEGAQP